MAKIKVQRPIVELDGDEMTRSSGRSSGPADPAVSGCRPAPLRPLDRVPRRHPRSDNRRSRRSDQAHGVGVKCATITPDEARVQEFGLHEMYRSPNGTIRNILGGVIFREPIVIANIPRLVPGWTQADRDRPSRLRRPVPRHRPRRARRGQADAHIRAQRRLPSRSSSTCTTSPDPASRWRCTTSTPPSATSPARPCATASTTVYPVYLSTKNTILKRYDGRFKDLFAEIYEDEFQRRVRGRRAHLRTPPDRRHGRRRAEVGRRLRVGLQELRRRRPIRHGRAGLRLARADDERADERRRHHRRGRGGARHGHPSLPPAPAGQAHLHQPDRLDLRLDARTVRARTDGRHARRQRVRRDARARMRADRRIRPA